MKKTGLIIMIVVLALGAIGFGYAAWSQNLSITGTANAATFAVTVDKTASSTITTPASYSTVTLAGTGPLTVTITQAVPGTYSIPLTITNSSTIPVDVTTGAITYPTEPANPTSMAGWITVPFSSPITIAASGTQDGTLLIAFPDTMPKTGGTYTFTIPITATQGAGG